MLSMVMYACYTREQFYPILLLLTSSKVSLVLLSNMAFAVALFLGQVAIKLVFGALRDVELEVIHERSKYSITETCLALTIFRSELSPTVLAFFMLLLFVKIFHWLSRCRLDYLEQVARASVLTHTSLLFVLFALIGLDSFVCYHCVMYSFSVGKTVIVLFAFEFGVLILTSVNNLVRYAVNVADNRAENGLQYKGLYFMILDLSCDGLRFCTYVVFFCILFVYYGFPLHIVRDVGMAFASFYHRLVSLIRYLRLTNKLEERLEDATEAELNEAQECLICRERMDHGKKLPCKHVFHLDCLRMWLQHQQTCPLCRLDIPVTSMNVRRSGVGVAGRRQVDVGVDPVGRDEGEDFPPPNDLLPHPAAENREEGLERLINENTLSGGLLSKSIPGFFIVLPRCNGGLNVMRVPGKTGQELIVRSLSENTVVFVSEYVSLSPPIEGCDTQKITWLRIPDGWIPMEKPSADDTGLTILLRSYLPPHSVGIAATATSYHAAARNPHTTRTTYPILPRAASQPTVSHPSTRRENVYASNGADRRISTKVGADPTNAAISDAIKQARNDISELTRSIRKASSDHSRASVRHITRSNSLSHRSRQANRSTDRIERLVAMQQQIDTLSNSIADISDSLSAIRAGLVSALTDELSLQNEDELSSHRSPTLSITSQTDVSDSQLVVPPGYVSPRAQRNRDLTDPLSSPSFSSEPIPPSPASLSFLDSTPEKDEDNLDSSDPTTALIPTPNSPETAPLSPGSSTDIRHLRKKYFNLTKSSGTPESKSQVAIVEKQGNDNKDTVGEL